ncbi:MAG: MarR family transcriptional regulator [Dehalococcoidia bacterium]|nr:MarR family transcriptional regulator [Dehalococcoidia bacterium]
MGDERPDIGILFSAVHRAYAERLGRRIASAGLGEVRPAHLFVIRMLAQNDTTITALARRLGTSKQAAVALVDELEEAGLATREPLTTDRRVKIIALTPRARTLLSEICLAGREIEEELADRVGPSMAQSLRCALQEFIDMSGGVDHVMALRTRGCW